MAEFNLGDTIRVSFEAEIIHLNTINSFDVRTVNGNEIEYIPTDDGAVQIENLSPQNFDVGDIVKRSDSWGHDDFFTVLGDNKAWSHDLERVVEGITDLNTANYTKVAGTND